MTRLLRSLFASATASLFAVAGASLAASTPVTDELLEPLTSAYARAVKPGEQAELYRELFATVLERVRRSHAREVDLQGVVAVALKTLEPLEPQSGEPAEVFRKAMNAALASLDPHSRYLNAREQSNERSALAGSFGGLGLEVDMIDGLVRIVFPMAGTPAARAGLQAGDLIVRFDDQPVLGLTLADAISRMRGEPGSPIALTVRRSGSDDEFAVSMIRETIRTQPLRWTMEGDVLVLRLTSFNSSVPAMLEKAIADATVKGT
ncbi:MAG TPA: PDZ domain-containing protein, partial [Burkholderiales bacterium]